MLRCADITHLVSGITGWGRRLEAASAPSAVLMGLVFVLQWEGLEG